MGVAGGGIVGKVAGVASILGSLDRPELAGIRRARRLALPAIR